MRDLQHWLAISYRPGLNNMHHKLEIPQQVITSLMRWTNPQHVMKGVLFNFPLPLVILTSDAFTLVWGAHFNKRYYLTYLVSNNLLGLISHQNKRIYILIY
ncbi:hypothetical protein G0U57_012957 [Chelydra serpentina]|uniref:Uncharacterized protein n=1 Tax=Chelydra serpentina TaxID=8475 RepID=A0A8T1SAW9_CHESE|nr:hypothetical protein G0U57_012957 [Chelydra serpentina]